MKKIALFSVFFLAVAASILGLMQCRHDGLNVKTLDPVCFQRDILPIFLNNCASCHGSGRAPGGYTFTDYNSILKSVDPYNAQKSMAYKAITGKGFVQLMPPSGALSENDRILVRVWIDQGAANTTCVTSTPTGSTPTGGSSSSDAGVVCFQRDILPIVSSSCGISGCHDQTSHREGVILTSYANVMTLVKAGSPTSSTFYNIVKNNQMPPSGYAKLTQAAKDSIYNWIKNGATNSTCTSSCDTTSVMSYTSPVSGIISKNCIGCHSGSSAQKGILLDTYANVKTYLDNGKLLAAVKGTSIQMPPGYKLTTCEIRQLVLWQSSGAKQ